MFWELSVGFFLNQNDLTHYWLKLGRLDQWESRLAHHESWSRWGENHDENVVFDEIPDHRSRTLRLWIRPLLPKGLPLNVFSPPSEHLAIIRKTLIHISNKGDLSSSWHIGYRLCSGQRQGGHHCCPARDIVKLRQCFNCLYVTTTCWLRYFHMFC